MRSSLFSLVLALSVAPALHAASAPADPNTGVTLQVQVSFAETQRPPHDVAFVSALVSRIHDTFAAQGYTGSIVEATGRETPNETSVLLKARVTEIRIRDARANCTFTASVRTHADELPLREYRVRNLNLSPEAKVKEPDAALLRLYQDLAGSKLVPGLATS